MYDTQKILSAAEDPSDHKALSAALKNIHEVVMEIEKRVAQIEKRITELEVMIHQAEM